MKKPRKAATYRAARRNATIHRDRIQRMAKIKTLRKLGWRRIFGEWIRPADL